MSYEQRQLEFRRRLRSMVAFIRAELPCPESPTGKKFFDMLGTIVHADEISCYVVVRRPLIYEDASYHVVLADGSAMDISISDFTVPKEKGFLSGFHIKHKDLEYDLSQIAAVEFGWDVTRFEQVYLADFCNGKLNVTGGQVNFVDDRIFTHSCAPTMWTANGAAVFGDNSLLLGICIGNYQGPTDALPRTILERFLGKIFGTQGLEEFLLMAKTDGMPSPPQPSVGGGG